MAAHPRRLRGKGGGEVSELYEVRQHMCGWHVYKGSECIAECAERVVAQRIAAALNAQAGVVEAADNDIRTKVRAIADSLRDREWADDLSEADTDVLDLREQITELVGRVTAGREVEVALWMLACGEARISRRMGVWAFCVNGEHFSLSAGFARCVGNVRRAYPSKVAIAEKHMERTLAAVKGVES